MTKKNAPAGMGQGDHPGFYPNLYHRVEATKEAQRASWAASSGAPLRAILECLRRDMSGTETRLSRMRDEAEFAVIVTDAERSFTHASNDLKRLIEKQKNEGKEST